MYPIFNDRRSSGSASLPVVGGTVNPPVKKDQASTRFKPVVGGAPKPNDPALGLATGMGGPKKPGQATRERATRMGRVHADVQAGHAAVIGGSMSGTPGAMPVPSGSSGISPQPVLPAQHTRASALAGRPEALFGLGAPAGAGGGMVGHANAARSDYFGMSGGVVGGRTPGQISTPAKAPGLGARLSSRIKSLGRR